MRNTPNVIQDYNKNLRLLCEKPVRITVKQSSDIIHSMYGGDENYNQEEGLVLVTSRAFRTCTM